MTPVATCRLQNQAGTIQLPPPRGAYAVRLGVAPAELTLTFRGTFPAAPIGLSRFPSAIDDDGIPCADIWHGSGFLDGYEWFFQVDTDLRTLTVLDGIPKPEPLIPERLTAEGLVVADEAAPKRRRHGQ